ncbi:protein ANTI-SILENCING 1 isoform X2 [Silene latifolia]|uniref:protein ANTI-SILENCING 1 isoform X2 n=1 Tax=Silene latifolia TaxID=37657 RepID=UPI003D77320E
MSDKNRKNAKIRDEIEFKWLKRRGRAPGDKDVCFYQSFMFDGVEYSLYDCVYLFKRGQSEPYIGKLVRIWGNAKTEERKVKVLWFFRPSEISNHLQGVNVLKNEIFLGTGVGPGLTNINPLEAIAGKCNVMCISKDDRNRQPSNDELELADYVFYRTFDVKNLSISDKLDEKIAMIDVELLLNKKNLQSVDLAKLDSANVTADVKSLISAKDDVAADTLVDVANNSVLVAGVEKMGTRNKDTEDSDRDIKFDAGLGSLLGYEKKQLTEKGDVATNENLSVVPSTSKCLLGSGQQINSKSPDSKQTELNKDGEGTVTVTATENGKSEPNNDVKKSTVVADKDKAKSEDRPSKKLKLDVTAKKSIVSGTKKSVNVSPASNNVLRSVACAAEIADGGKLISESESISGTPLGKQKFNSPVNGKSGDRPDKVSVKQSKDKDLDNCVSKAPHRPNRAAESKDRVKLLRERDATSEGISKKRRTNNFSEHQSTNKVGKEIKQPKDGEVGGYAQVKEVTLPPLDKTKWFTDGLWEDRINGANDQGKLVLLQNLDPTYSADEVQGIILDGFHERCTVKIVQHTATSSPHAGQAFAIFSNREVAEMVMRKLEQGCLMLPNGRPLVGTNHSMTLHGKQSQYFGHIVLEKTRQQKQKREAVSTSHSSQSNTLEYEMALEWQLLQDRSDLCWKYLYQHQGGEMRKLNTQLKSK